MTYSATLTRTGQITIPKAVREALGVKPGQRIVFNIEKKTAKIERQKTVDEITDEIHALVPDYARKNFIEKNAGKTASEIREEWLKSNEAREYYEERRRRCL